MPSKMYENIDNELLDRLRPLELNPCPAQENCENVI